MQIDRKTNLVAPLEVWAGWAALDACLNSRRVWIEKIFREKEYCFRIDAIQEPTLLKRIKCIPGLSQVLKMSLLAKVKDYQGRSIVKNVLTGLDDSCCVLFSELGEMIEKATQHGGLNIFGEFEIRIYRSHRGVLPVLVSITWVANDWAGDYMPAKQEILFSKEFSVSTGRLEIEMLYPR